MSISPGTKLGPYEILAPLGSGGMGEVYRARDERLGREVAIKVLPESFAHDPDRLRRFEQEARAAGALNHPNILSIHDIGTHNGAPYIATELLEGVTLRERLEESPLPVRKALDFGAQIAAGLAAAHEKGIVHRDLKPENLFVTPDGRVKILDFGLAKLTHPELAGGQATAATVDSPPTAPTHPGAVLGTVGYMSPEQVRGRAADNRSDIFSLGAILHEMISGQRVFHGDSAVETMNAILKQDVPELAPRNPLVSPAVDRLIARCLEKSPQERFQSAHDLGFALGALSGVSASSAAHAAIRAGESPRRWLLPAVGVVLLVAVTAASFYVGWRRGKVQGAEGVTFTPMSYRPQAIFRVAFSPDEKTVVYSAALEGNRPEIFLLGFDYPEPRALGLPDTQLLSISSRGELALLTHAKYVRHRMFNGTLARMALGGGAPRELLENVREADWAPDGESLAIIRTVDGKDRLEFPIGKVLYETGGYVSDLRFSRDGSRIAFFDHAFRFDDRGRLAVVDLQGHVTVFPQLYWGMEGLAWSPDGREMLFTAGTNYSQFMVHAMTPGGQHRLVLQSAGGLTLQDVSATGRWLVSRDDIHTGMVGRLAGDAAEHDLSWLDHSQAMALSADARTLLFSEESGVMGPNYATCIRRSGSSPVRLGEGWAGGLSPDGQWALAVIPTAPDQLMLYPTGPGAARKLEQGNIHVYSSVAWFPDGKRILVCGTDEGKSSRCYVQDLSGGAPRPVTPEGTTGGTLSPDGKQLLVRGQGGEALLFPADGGEPRPLPFLLPGEELANWSRDSRSVLVFSVTEVPSRLLRVDLITGQRTPVRQIAPADLAGTLSIYNVLISSDEKSYAYSYNQYRSTLFLVEKAQ